MHLLNELAAQPAIARSPDHACALAAAALAKYPTEVAFAFVYLFDGDGLPGRLVGATRTPASDEKWPLEEVAATSETVLLTERSALVVPLRTACEPRAVGALVAGASPGCAIDDDLRRFFGQVAGHISATIAVARVQVQADKHAETVALQDHALQTFFVISLMAQAALSDLPPDRVTDSVAAALVQISAVATGGSEHLREAIFAMGHADGEQNGVTDALERLVRSFQQRTGIDAELLVSGTPRRLSAELADTLHHAAAEALANVENRSRASAVVLSLHVARHTVTLSIQDDGVERDSRTIGPIASSATHVGLGRVGQRVQRVGGTFVAQLAHDGGFRVRVRLPLKATAAR